jgi:hypothetical protein
MTSHSLILAFPVLNLGSPEITNAPLDAIIVSYLKFQSHNSKSVKNFQGIVNSSENVIGIFWEYPSDVQNISWIHASLHRPPWKYPFISYGSYLYNGLTLPLSKLLIFMIEGALEERGGAWMVMSRNLARAYLSLKPWENSQFSTIFITCWSLSRELGKLFKTPPSDDRPPPIGSEIF